MHLGIRATRRRDLGRRQPSCVRGGAATPILALIAVLVLAPGAIADAADEKNAADSDATEPAALVSSASASVPIAEIALRATEVARLLGTFTTDLVTGADVEAIGAALPSVSRDVGFRLRTTEDMLAQEPPLEALQAADQVWQQRQLELGDWLATLTNRATRLQGNLAQLATLEATWTRTRETAQAAEAPDAIRQQIDATLAAVAGLMPQTRTQLEQALDLQGRIAADVVRCEHARSRIAELQRGAVGGFLVRDSHPIWSPAPWAQALDSVGARLPEIAASYGADIRSYLHDPAKLMPLHLAVFVLALVALFAVRGQVDEWAAAGRTMTRMTVVFDRPFAAALLPTLLIATIIFSPTPLGVKQIFAALALIPMILLARPVVPRSLVSPLYALGVLFALDTLRHAFAGVPPLVGQIITLVESVVGALILARLLYGIWSHGTSGEEGRSGWERFWWLIGTVALLGLTIGGLASLFGYMRLARITTPAILVGSADALWLYATVEVAGAVSAYLLRVWPLRALRMVRSHRKLLDARALQLFVVMAVLTWCSRYLNYLGLWDPVASNVERLLTTRFTMGSFGTSAGDVLAFFLTLVFAYVVSAILRFVLAEEIYPRTGVAAGVSYAASSVIHYMIVVVAFLLALGFLGVTLTQVTVLAGALGVGIGFGLQGMVNNFVSGLILLFERPINVGDAVQVGNLQGWVRRIGIRASIVRTLDGAEIIVPNGQLTTEQVTNWTLSDRQRRIAVTVGLAYGTSAEKAIELLEGVARLHPQVLADPPPRCLFTGYGDSSINFELRAWTEYSTSIPVQSDLTVAVYAAVYAAGMSFPFPQREVRVLSDPPTTPKATTAFEQKPQ